MGKANMRKELSEFTKECKLILANMIHQHKVLENNNKTSILKTV